MEKCGGVMGISEQLDDIVLLMKIGNISASYNLQSVLKLRGF